MKLVFKISKILCIHSKIKFNLILLLLLFASLAESAGIVLILPIVRMISSETDTINLINYVLKKEILIIIIFIFFILKYFFLIFVYSVQSKYIYSIQNYFSNLLFQKYLNASLINQKKINTNVISRNIYNEVNEFAQISNIMISSINELIILLCIFFIFLLFLPLSILFISLCMFVAGLFCINILSKKIKKIGFERQEFDGKRLTVINEAFKGIKEIIVFNVKDVFFNKYSNYSFNSANQSAKMLFIKHLPRISIEFIVVILFLIFLIINLSNQTLDNEKVISIFALLGASMFRMLPSVNKLIIGFNQINYGKAVIEIVDNGLKDEDKFLKKKLKKRFSDKFKKISFKDVSFSYNNIKILNNINFEIKKGEKIGMMGRSGSGKTTLIDLLIGLIKPDEGQILINGTDSNNINLYKSNLFSYVPQKSFVLDDSLINNITFGNISQKKNFQNYIDFIIKNSCLTDFKKEIKDNTNIIGDSGNKLSGGQIQRITIARALFKKSKILIMDEATSSLDKPTARNILNNIKNYYKNLTLIIISHDKDLLSLCDKIYKLENGKLKLL